MSSSTFRDSDRPDITKPTYVEKSSPEMQQNRHWKLQTLSLSVQPARRSDALAIDDEQPPDCNAIIILMASKQKNIFKLNCRFSFQ